MKVQFNTGALALLALVALVPSICEGIVLTKCELKNILQELIANHDRLPQNVSAEDITAKIVCHVELTSGFNTSAVREIPVPRDLPPFPGNRGNRRPRSPRGGRKGRFGLASFMRPDSGSSSMEGSGSSSEEDSGSSEENSDVWTLYGLFQLADRVACDSGNGPSLNLCDLNCDSLIDDDISDDIACTEILKSKMMTMGGGPRRAFGLIKKMIALLFQSECARVVASEYFAECA